MLKQHPSAAYAVCGHWVALEGKCIDLHYIVSSIAGRASCLVLFVLTKGHVVHQALRCLAIEEVYDKLAVFLSLPQPSVDAPALM